MNQCDPMSPTFPQRCIAVLAGIGHAATTKETDTMKNTFGRAGGATMLTKTLGILAGLALFSGSALATPSVGMTSQSTRSKITFNLYSTQWGSTPLFNMVMQTSGDQWGYDLIHAQNTFAPATADGTPSQSGWHNHPVPIGFVQVIQGGVWIQEAP